MSDCNNIKPFRTTLLFVGGCAVGAVVGYLFKPAPVAEPCPPEGNPLIEAVAAFDATTLSEMLSSANAVRFYHGNDGTNNTSVAGPVDGSGKHLPTDRPIFHRYDGFFGTGPVITSIDETVAKEVVTRANPTWSIDLQKVAVQSMLNTPDCKAIALVERMTSDGIPTFDLVPVKYDQGKYRQVGTVRHTIIGMPCPNYCGEKDNYLHMH